MLKVQNSYVTDTVINKKILQEDTKEFANQFTELESFVNAMMDYSISLN
jgi:hypothetical protein